MINPNIEDAFNGRELKVCSDTVECCKELSRVWLALGDGAIKRPYLGSASERVKKLRTEIARLKQIPESTYVDAVALDAALATLDGVQTCLENLRSALLRKSEPK